MNNKIIIIGAGIGGLSAAIRLANEGFRVEILEARNSACGLASGFNTGGFNFDAGPYILLDKPGLEWAFKQLNINFELTLPMTLIQDIYQVQDADDTIISFKHDLELTADMFEKQFEGSRILYKKFVKETFKIHQALKPLTYKSHPGLFDILKHKALFHIPFLLNSLHDVLKRTKLPLPIQNGIGIWTHVAAQSVEKAPSPMAFVPSIFHHIGSYYPKGGMRSIGDVLLQTALKSGVNIRYQTSVQSIKRTDKKVCGVVTHTGEYLTADAVVSNVNAMGTYKNLLDNYPENKKKKLDALPLQSPGVSVYLAVKGKHPPHYIRFNLKNDRCVAFIQPGLLEPSLEQDGWFPARLIAPLDYTKASKLGEFGQQQLIAELLNEAWWQEGIYEYKILHSRTTLEWGEEFHLYNNSMNPVMTSQFMLKGRFSHKSKDVKGLYLTGSSTHPGQWVSFCAISGILSANLLINDFRHA